MISLFIDTSSVNVSISIIEDNSIKYLIQKDIPNMHSVYTTKYIKDVLDNSKTDIHNIDKLMVVNGPGSFTGIRIGVTIAKTIGYLLKKEITPVSSLKSLAISSNSNNKYIMSIIPANKNNYYLGIYDSNFNNIVEDNFVNKDMIIKLYKKYNPYVISNTDMVIDDIKVNNILIDTLKVVNYYIDKTSENCYKILPNYLKLPQALEDRK